MILNPRKIAALLLAALPAIACAGEPEDALVTAAGTLEEPCSAVSDSGKRIECLRKGRDSGSLYLLGMAYRSGDGVKADQDQALRLLRRASKRGSARASLELARIYRGPRKSERDTDALALQYAKTSCSQKSPDGCTLYGAMLMAEAPEENAEEAAEAFAMASSRGSGEAFLHLGRMSLLGLVTKGKMTAEERTDLVEATPDTGAYVSYSSALKRLAVKLSKICNDLRLMASGPRCGLNEINLPPKAPGSSIMPGKVNPVIPEVVNQVCFKVIGNDTTVSFAAEAGQLQLNVMEPVITESLFESLIWLKNAIETLTEECVLGITVNKERCMEMVKNSIGIVTALNPYIGYKTSTKVAKEALDTNRSVYDIVLEKGLMTQEKLDEALDPKNMLCSHR